MIESVSDRIVINHLGPDHGRVQVFEDTLIQIDGVAHGTTTYASYRCEGDLLTAAKILEPYDDPNIPKSRARKTNEAEELREHKVANILAQRVRPVASLAPLPHNGDYSSVVAA